MTTPGYTEVLFSVDTYDHTDHYAVCRCGNEVLKSLGPFQDIDVAWQVAKEMERRAQRFIDDAQAKEHRH